MPHFGLMDENALSAEQAFFQRARLHIRAGKRRLRQGKISAGIATLYDAFTSAMHWCIESPDRSKGLIIDKDDDLNNDSTLFSILRRSNAVDGRFDFESFRELTEKALEEEIRDYDYKKLLEEFEDIMTQLGVMPFDEEELPKEDPKTF